MYVYIDQSLFLSLATDIQQNASGSEWLHSIVRPPIHSHRSAIAYFPNTVKNNLNLHSIIKTVPFQVCSICDTPPLPIINCILGDINFNSSSSIRKVFTIIFFVSANKINAK